MGDAGAAMVPATFLVILGTVATYGLTAGWLARRLGLAVANPQGLLFGGANPLARTLAQTLQKEGFRSVLVDTRYRRLQKAREMGLSVCYANILSEHVLNEVDFGGIGRFLALTANDEVNSLAAARFRELFGRENVYQLPTPAGRHSRDEEDLHHFTGRRLFSAQCTYEWLDAALDAGAKVKVTRLSKEFPWTAFRAHYQDKAWPLFIIEDSRLTICTADQTPAPKPGQSVVSLVLSGVSDPAAAQAAVQPPGQSPT
jgi:hypothetical protein